jgi:hypothetical protein
MLFQRRTGLADKRTTLIVASAWYHYVHWRWYARPKEQDRAPWSEPYQEPTSDTIVITCSVPFYRDEQGRQVFQGVVTASLNLACRQDIVATAKVFDHGYAFLRKKNADAKKAEAMRKMVKDCLTEGQQISGKMGYIPLPANVLEVVLKGAENIQWTEICDATIRIGGPRGIGGRRAAWQTFRRSA